METANREQRVNGEVERGAVTGMKRCDDACIWLNKTVRARPVIVTEPEKGDVDRMNAI